jgi:hypothetical protein
MAALSNLSTKSPKTLMMSFFEASTIETIFKCQDVSPWVFHPGNDQWLARQNWEVPISIKKSRSLALDRLIISVHSRAKRILTISGIYISQKSSLFSDRLEHLDFHPAIPNKSQKTYQSRSSIHSVNRTSQKLISPNPLSFNHHKTVHFFDLKLLFLFQFPSLFYRQFCCKLSHAVTKFILNPVAAFSVKFVLQTILWNFIFPFSLLSNKPSERVMTFYHLQKILMSFDIQFFVPPTSQICLSSWRRWNHKFWSII